MRARLDLPAAHARALLRLLERVPPERYGWVLVGSAGLRLQGLDLPVNDLDLECAGQEIYDLERALGDWMREAVHVWDSGRLCSLDGKAEVEGVPVELIAELSVVDGDARTPVADLSRRIWLDWRAQRVPVFPLEFEAESYQRMGRPQKADLIRTFLKGQGHG